ncbi:hypothetical protein Bbelb_068050 [Branchiostoma belcheri]|nr:hypothetical protein Bbelb_068050 [Branchiostoma belcheri]
MPQISTTDNLVEAIHHMVVNDRCETGQHVAVEDNDQREKERKAPSWRDDNAPVHTAQGSVAASNEFGFAVEPHPFNSPDLAPSDFYLFPKLNFHLRSQRFDGNDDVIYAV